MAIEDEARTTSTMDPNIDPKADAKRVFDVLSNGGLAIIPVDVGYAICAGGELRSAKIYRTL
jgi:tRNA A37 threonylcarbamoyladenosine synthetase subunit TsaC/SUA5/YrdC